MNDSDLSVRKPVVSVIVLCRNQEQSVGDAIESVLRQKTDFPFEIVIGDDCSEDDTRKVCEDYAGRYPDIIRLLPTAERLGLVGNYRRCFMACRGEFISDCSGDDVWEGETRLKYAVGKMRGFTEVDVVFSDFRRVADGKPEDTGVYSRLPYSRWRRDLTGGSRLLIDVLNHVNALPYMLSAAVYRREVVASAAEKNSDMVFNDSFGIEDVPVMAALAAAGNAAFNPDITFCYSIHPGSLSNSGDRGKLALLNLKSLRCSRILGDYYGIPQKCLRDIFRSKTAFIASSVFDHGDKDMAKNLREELRHWHLTPSVKVRCYLSLTGIVGMKGFISCLRRIFQR